MGGSAGAQHRMLAQLGGVGVNGVPGDQELEERGGGGGGGGVGEERTQSGTSCQSALLTGEMNPSDDVIIQSGTQI